ncbi:MAG TPA: hypothetical protein PLV72_01830 [Candidatus Magasanikbacteria bacterium]|nr:hypothetical protein [Candidatus Magasanikbacteria bacterium]
MSEVNRPEHIEEIIKDYNKDVITAGDTVRFEGKLYRAVNQPTGYTIREYYSHSTESMGPGPGWDTHLTALQKYGVSSVADLPDEPHTTLELLPIEE